MKKRDAYRVTPQRINTHISCINIHKHFVKAVEWIRFAGTVNVRDEVGAFACVRTEVY